MRMFEMDIATAEPARCLAPNLALTNADRFFEGKAMIIPVVVAAGFIVRAVLTGAALTVLPILVLAILSVGGLPILAVRALAVLPIISAASGVCSRGIRRVA